jgi:hypothetical protein
MQARLSLGMALAAANSRPWTPSDADASGAWTFES